jgi:hypothetical protein
MFANTVDPHIQFDQVSKVIPILFVAKALIMPVYQLFLRPITQVIESLFVFDGTKIVGRVKKQTVSSVICATSNGVSIAGPREFYQGIIPVHNFTY